MSDTNTESQETTVEEVDQELDQDDVDTVEEPDTDQDDQDQDDDNASILDKLRKKNSENRNLRKAKKEAEERAANASKDSERANALEAVNTRYETLAENDLPLKMAKFITATDPDEILEQAEELMSLTGGNAPPSDTPKERVKKQRKTVQKTDEIGSLDDFAAKAYDN